MYNSNISARFRIKFEIVIAIGESHTIPYHSNELLVYDGGIPKIMIRSPNTKHFWKCDGMSFVNKALQNLSHIHSAFYK